VKETRLQNHIREVHEREASMADPAVVNQATAPKKLRNEVLQQRLERALDATKEFAHNFREKGRYGSHPSHDNYDDEGNP
jgi:hypothetical protein